MHKIFTKACLSFFLCWSVFTMHGQDIHFSHIHASPTILNPAMNGLINGGDIRFIVNARSQWNSFTKGYKTIAGSMDMKLANVGSSIIGGGLQLYADKAGDLDFTTMSANLAFSAMKSFNRQGTNIVSFGLQGGYVSNSMDFSKMEGFDDETFMYEGVNDNIHYLDLNAGVGWFYQIERHQSFYIGASVSHLNKPDVSFMSVLGNQNTYSSESAAIPLFRKVVLHGGGNFRTGKQMSILPTFIFMDQGPHRELTFGSFVKLVKGTSFSKATTAFYMGAWMRMYVEKDLIGQDAMLVSFRLDHNKTFYTISFDMNLSKLKRVSHGMGGPELSVIKILDTNRRLPGSNKVICPDF